MAKFIIVSMIKPICKYLARVGNKISCPKLGTYYQLLCAKQRRKAGVILGQNHVQLLNATFDSLFFFKNLLHQKQCKYARNIGVAQIRGGLLLIFRGEKCPLYFCRRLPLISKVTLVLMCNFLL